MRTTCSRSFTGQLDDDTVINVVAGVAGSVAGITGDIFVNAQEGDNSSDVSQAANATSGDGVGGQVLGIVSAGEASVDATNTSEDVDIETGDADADNLLGSFTGQLADDTVINVIAAGAGAAAAIIGDISVNAQDGDNSSDLSQAANATSGDGVGGQIIGVVTSASGSADVVAANTSEDVDVETGDADADNSLGSFVGQIANDTATTVVAANTAGVASITGDIFVNAQEGDNSSDVSQAANATSGDGVGGQVLGIVSAGEASVDATNELRVMSTSRPGTPMRTTCSVASPVSSPTTTTSTSSPRSPKTSPPSPATSPSTRRTVISRRIRPRTPMLFQVTPSAAKWPVS